MKENLTEEETKEKTENIMERRIVTKKGRIGIFTIYSQNLKETGAKLDRIIEEDREDRLVIGGDFNAKIGLEGERVYEKEKEKQWRSRSKDKVINAEGKCLLFAIKRKKMEPIRRKGMEPIKRKYGRGRRRRIHVYRDERKVGY